MVELFFAVLTISLWSRLTNGYWFNPPKPDKNSESDSPDGWGSFDTTDSGDFDGGGF